jgi:hypothetical protein
MQLDAAARVQEAPRHPGRRQPQQAGPFIEGPIEDFGDIIRLHDFRLRHGRQKLQRGWRAAMRKNDPKKASGCCIRFNPNSQVNAVANAAKIDFSQRRKVETRYPTIPSTLI